MRSPRRYLLAFGVILALGNLGATFHRSGILISLTGQVEAIEVVHQKHPGSDDVYFVAIAGRKIHLDADVASLMSEGDTVRKGAWSTSLETPRGIASIGVSRDFTRMAVAMPLIVALVSILLLRDRRRDREKPTDGM